MREVVIDTETTGLDYRLGHGVIELAAVELINKVPTKKKFHTYLKPRNNLMDRAAYNVHKITLESLKDKPSFSDIADDFLSFIKGAKLIIHNAKFDIGFLNNELYLSSKPLIKESEVIDTLKLAREKFPRNRSASLDALCNFFNINKSSRNEAHGALIDATLLAKVYIELTGGLQVKFNFSGNVSESSVPVLNEISNYEKLSRPFKNLSKVIKPTNAELEEHKVLISRIKNHMWFDAS